MKWFNIVVEVDDTELELERYKYRYMGIKDFVEQGLQDLDGITAIKITEITKEEAVK